MKEAYCSYELSKLLKEKGFDEPCMSFWEYELYEYSLYIAGYPITNSELEKELIDGCSAPTHQMAMAWLREEKNLWCEITWEGKNSWCSEIFDVIKEEYISKSIKHNVRTYEEAVETALKYCLENLI